MMLFLCVVTKDDGSYLIDPDNSNIILNIKLYIISFYLVSPFLRDSGGKHMEYLKTFLQMKEYNVREISLSVEIWLESLER